MKELTQADYDTIVEMIAIENMTKEPEDKHRHLHESVNFSEWTFKPNLAKKIMEYTEQKNPEGPYMAMMDDVRQEIKRFEQEAEEYNS